MTYDEFVKEVMQDPQKSLPFDLRDISYEQAKDYLMVDVCNEKMNREDLCEMPHERKGDLALRYLLFWKEPESNVRISILVNDTLFRKWGIEETTLKQDAWENMKKKIFCPATGTGKRGTRVSDIRAAAGHGIIYPIQRVSG